MFLKVQLKIQNFNKPKKTISLVHTKLIASQSIEIPNSEINSKRWAVIRDEFEKTHAEELHDLHEWYKKYHPLNNDGSLEYGVQQAKIRDEVTKLENLLLKEFINQEPQWFI